MPDGKVIQNADGEEQVSLLRPGLRAIHRVVRILEFAGRNDPCAAKLCQETTDRLRLVLQHYERSQLPEEAEE